MTTSPPATGIATARRLPAGVSPGGPLTALAPMQDVTGLAFMRIVAAYGPPDYFFTEYFRVFEGSPLDADGLRAIADNDTGRPVFAQLIGEHIPSLVRTAQALQAYPVAGIDLNMGCPAPKIYRRNVGGGLLRVPDHVDALLGALRDAVPGLLTVKMRVGFDSTEPFLPILDLVDKHGIDLLSIHGRTVADLYRGDVRYDLIAHAARTTRCPVLANGNVSSADTAMRVLADTGAAGVMIGRHAIRNPWIFAQTRDRLAGRPVRPATRGDVRGYVDRLYRETRRADGAWYDHVARAKKYLNFVGQGIDPDGAFLHAMRRTRTEAELMAVCDAFLLGEPDAVVPLEAFPGVHARPNSEAPAGDMARPRGIPTRTRPAEAPPA